MKNDARHNLMVLLTASDPDVHAIMVALSEFVLSQDEKLDKLIRCATIGQTLAITVTGGLILSAIVAVAAHMAG